MNVTNSAIDMLYTLRGIRKVFSWGRKPLTSCVFKCALLQDVQNVTTDTQDTISESIKDTTAASGKSMSSTDVQNSVEVIDQFLDTPDLELSDTTIDNLMSTMDNIQTETEETELRTGTTGDEFRDSAVTMANKLAQEEEDYMKSMDSIGESRCKLQM